MKRRDFLQTTAGAAGAALLAAPAVAADAADPRPERLPRWRGFNLLEKFTLRLNAPYVERDFEWAAQWGFDFFRLPTDYRCWTDEDDPRKLDEEVLGHIDQAVEWGKQYGIHININLHRAPGYCVNPPPEPLNLWTDEEAQDLFRFQWSMFAERYKGVSNRIVSFNLLNEPSNIDEELYAPVMRSTVEAIREIDPERLIMVDGLRWGLGPVHSLADLGVAQSTRGYAPMRISHHRASWVSGSDTWETPTWPLGEGDNRWDKERLSRENIQPWIDFQAQGVGVHVGEWGCFRHTPHDVALAWMEDILQLWQEAGWGWGMWNFRGSFGILDSQREDVEYEDFHGHHLDRKMLELIQRY